MVCGRIMIPQYVYFTIFAIIGYVIITDNNVLTAIFLVAKLVRFQYEKMKWWIIHNPANPVVKYMIWRRSMRLAKELEKELNDRNK
jgi:hypothetical protein